MSPKTLIISGAGFHFFGELGAISTMNPDEFDIFAGTSAGAFLGVALALGFTGQSLLDWAIENDARMKVALKESVLHLLFYDATR